MANYSNHEKPILLKQAFDYFQAENNMMRAESSSFSTEVVKKLQKNVEITQTKSYYESLVREIEKFKSLIKNDFALKKEIFTLQSETNTQKINYLKITITSEGVFVVSDDSKSLKFFLVRLFSLDVQTKPLYPLLNHKLFQGILGWVPHPSDGEAPFRILMNLMNEKNELKQHAVYFCNFKTLQKIKSSFIVFSKKAVFSNYFLKFLIVE